jgi:hypothetical protein|nr:MAG TPA: hypothetical protein [Caudoviricetes sp.]
MMTKEQMIDRYEELYHKMKTSKDVKNMKAFGDAMTWTFGELAKVHPDMAEKFLSHIECIEWENFLSQDEAKNIGMRIVNQDGIKGFHWTYDVFTKAVESLGGVVEEKPYYNSYALYVTACTIYSDHALSIAMDLGYKEPKEVPNEKMALSCYRKAVEKLKDIDGGFQVRKYFKGKMYADSPM